MTDLYEGVDRAVRLALLAAFVARPLTPELTPRELKALVLAEGISEPLYDEAIERGARWRDARSSVGITIESLDLVALRMRGLFPRQLRYDAADKICRAFRSLNEKMGAKAPKTLKMLGAQGVAMTDAEPGLGLLLIYELAKRVEGGFTCTTPDMRGYCDEDRHDASELEARLEVMARKAAAIFAARPAQTPGKGPTREVQQPGKDESVDPTHDSLLTAPQRSALDLVASMIIDDQQRLPMGLDVRRRMTGASREAKTEILQQLVPDYLSIHGRGREDSYSLTPRGALRCARAARFLQVAGALRPFLIAEYIANKTSVTWESIKASVLIDGRAPVENERVLVGYVLICLGVWGGTDSSWPRPLAPQLEDLLDDDLDVRALFMRVHDELVGQRAMFQGPAPKRASPPDQSSDKMWQWDPQEVRLRAKEIFEEHFAACDRSVNVIPEEPADRAALHELARKGLAEETSRGGAFRIGPRGVEVCMGEAKLDSLLGLGSTPFSAHGFQVPETGLFEFDEGGLDADNQADETPSVTVAGTDKRKVFIIHGRNVAARNAVEQFVRSLGLDPLDFDQVASDLGGSPFIGEVVRKGLELAHGIIALFTSDEFAALAPSFRAPSDKPDDIQRWQSRPNVLFEAGMAFGMDKDRTVLVTLGREVSLFSDVAGVHTIRLNNHVESRKSFRKRLIGMKCAVDTTLDSWTDPARSGDFETCCIVGLSGVSPRDPFDSAATRPARAAAKASGPSLSEDAKRYMLNIARAYAKAGHPNHKVWPFDKGAETPVHSELKNGFGLIKLMGTRGSSYLLTDDGHDWVMAHKDDADAGA